MPLGFAHSLIRPLFNPVRGSLSPSSPELLVSPTPVNNIRVVIFGVRNTTPAGADRDLVVELFMRTEEFGDIPISEVILIPESVSFFPLFPFQKPNSAGVRVKPAGTGASWSSALVIGNTVDCYNLPGAAKPFRLTTSFQEVVPPRLAGQRLSSIFGGAIKNLRALDATISAYLQEVDGTQFVFEDVVVPAGSISNGPPDLVLQPGDSLLMKVDAGVGDVYFFSDWLDTPASRQPPG